MHDSRAHEKLSCQSCHSSHAYDTRSAAYKACVGCHDDEHTRNYEGSKHQALWLAELAGDTPAGSGVSCATCHLPRVKGDEGTFVQHNQNDNLRPNEKMIRSACISCHGVPFAIDALADATLVKNNFRGTPSEHVQSVDYVRARQSPNTSVD
jgi:hypothetical protein